MHHLDSVHNFFIVECQRSSRIVNQLGLVNKLKLKISAHKTDTEKQKSKLDIELEGEYSSRVYQIKTSSFIDHPLQDCDRNHLSVFSWKGTDHCSPKFTLVFVRVQ